MTHLKPGMLLQRGVGLIELMVAMVIGLLTTLVVMQVFSVFEGDKRTTTSGADAQTNGTVALYQIKREIANAGFGLPILGGADPDTNFPLSCDENLSLGGVGLFPIVLVDGASGASDSVWVRSGTSATGGVPIKVIDTAVGGDPLSIGVNNSSACQKGDQLLLVSDATKVVSGSCGAGPTVDVVVSNTQIKLNSPSPVGLNTSNSKIACVRGWSQTTYSVDPDKGLLSGANALVDGIVSIQAQYGLAAGKNSNLVVQWVDPTGAYADPVSLANRQLIRAIRIAVVARSGLREKENVTSNALSWAGGAIDISDLPGSEPQKFRYRIFETVIPLRNIIWTSNSL